METEEIRRTLSILNMLGFKANMTQRKTKIGSVIAYNMLLCDLQYVSKYE
jgi:hypothetical protein